MSKVNPTVKAPVKAIDTRLAGGYGAKAAKQDAESLLRRAVLCSLLWENLAYEDGRANSDNIAALIPLVDAQVVADIALEARLKQKLRHVPLFIACEMLKHSNHKALVADLLPKIITRADQMSDMLAIYWKSNPDAALAAQLKKGLAACFNKFSEYELAKYDRNGAIKLRDVMFLVHPKPIDQSKEVLFKKIADRTLDTPDTWEVALSTGNDKRATWERLINENKLGALAFLRNLRNMQDVGVNHHIIRKGFAQVKSPMLLPLNFLAALEYAPSYKKEIETLMFATYAQLPKLPGYTVFIVDVSGSMGNTISSKSKYKRLDVAKAMALLAVNQCEQIDIFCTAGSDGQGKHSTAQITHPSLGFDLFDQITQQERRLGGGGIFTRQCLEYIQPLLKQQPDRIIVFSDSQDCDRGNKIPNPFGVHNYIVDVSAHRNGINYQGKWTAEVSGWSEHFLTYISAMEGLEVLAEEESMN